MLRTDLGLRTFSSLSEIPGIVHAFAAADAFSGFDAARNEDRERLREALAGGRSFELIRTRQTHSSRVALVTNSAVGPQPDGAVLEPGVDGLVTTEPGLLLHAISADCPLLFLADRNRRAVGIAHCGWRGVAAGIVEETVSRLRDASGGARTDWVAAISPGARSCCYEVGGEVIAAIERRGVPRPEFVVPYRRSDGARSHAIALDLVIRRILAASGVSDDAIESAAECSICGGESFHSYRRTGGATGRMSGVIGRVAP